MTKPRMSGGGGCRWEGLEVEGGCRWEGLEVEGGYEEDGATVLSYSSEMPHASGISMTYRPSSCKEMMYS